MNMVSTAMVVKNIVWKEKVKHRWKMENGSIVNTKSVNEFLTIYIERGKGER